MAEDGAEVASAAVGEDSEGSEVDRQAEAAQVEAGRWTPVPHGMNQLGFLGYLPAPVGEERPDSAPIGVFIVLGIVLAIVVLLLYFMVPVSGDDLTYQSTQYYSGPFGGFGGFGPFGGL